MKREDFRALADRRLDALSWDAQKSAAVARALAAPARPRRARLTVALAALLLLLLTATAIAIGLRYSARYDNERVARGALAARYGLTEEMLDIFGARETRAKDGWTVRFTPYAMDIEAIGEYLVTRDAKGAITASWTHDGADISHYAANDLSAPAWGSAQLGTAIALRRAADARYAQIDWASWEDWSLETRAQAYQALVEAGADYPVIDIAPGQDDLPEDAALALARGAVAAKYGVSQDALNSADTRRSFRLIREENERVYVFTFDSPAGAPRAYQYEARILSPSGAVKRCMYYADAASCALPAGDLAPYPEAVREYMDSGAFDLLSARDKAAAAARISQAGLGAYLPETAYDRPGAQDLAEASAIALARDALTETFGFTTDTLAYFAPRTALIPGEPRLWRVTFVPAATNAGGWEEEFAQRAGEYAVTLSAKDGAALSCRWSLAGADTGTQETRWTPSTWGAARAYPAYVLPWLLDMRSAQQAIRDQYPGLENDCDMTLQDQAACDLLMREAGFDLINCSSVLPGAGELQLDAAIALARHMLINERALDAQALDKCFAEASCNLQRDEAGNVATCWSVTFQGYGADRQDSYTVVLDAATGDLEQIIHDTPASGNG